MMRYAILERTPFPGYFRPLSQYALQRAERALKMGQPQYHVRAQRFGTLWLYSWEDAQRIIEYWQGIHLMAEYQVFGYVGSTTIAG